MHKKLSLLTLLVIFCFSLSSQSFYKVDFNSQTEQESYFNIPGFTVHYYNDSFLIGSGSLSESSKHKMFETTAWDKGNEYLLVWLPKTGIESYITELDEVSEILYKSPTYIIIKTDIENVNKIIPAVHNGLIKINRTKANLCIKDKGQSFKNTLNPDPLIEGYVAEVLSANVMADIQHLEDYGTRVYNTSEASLAEAWIQDEFESYGLPTELSATGAGGSMNVTATQTGMVFPNKFIMVGGHYDSTSYGSTAPGADDNASGTASVLEIARILSQYEFNYSIIYCAWSAEEIGLYGSGAWASNAASSTYEWQSNIR